MCSAWPSTYVSQAEEQLVTSERSPCICAHAAKPGTVLTYARARELACQAVRICKADANVPYFFPRPGGDWKKSLQDLGLPALLHVVHLVQMAHWSSSLQRNLELLQQG